MNKLKKDELYLAIEEATFSKTRSESLDDVASKIRNFLAGSVAEDVRHGMSAAPKAGIFCVVMLIENGEPRASARIPMSEGVATYFQREAEAEAASYLHLKAQAIQMLAEAL